MAQTLADATSVALLQQHSIEQAIGILAERGRLSMDAAFASLRAYARNNNHQLSFVAELVVGGQTPLDDVLATNREERLPRSGD